MLLLKLTSKVRTLHSSIMASSKVRFSPSASCFLPTRTHCHYLEATEKVQLLITSCCHAPKGSRTWGPCQIKRDNRDSDQRIRCDKTASVLCNVVMARRITGRLWWKELRRSPGRGSLKSAVLRTIQEGKVFPCSSVCTPRQPSGHFCMVLLLGGCIQGCNLMWVP